MVGPWVNSGRRRSVVFLQRIHSYHRVKKRFVLPSTKTNTLDSMDRSNGPVAPSKLSTSASTWRPQQFDGLESLWGPTSQNAQSGNAENLAPLVIKNPVHPRELEEPIERKREYWSENLLYVMRREGLIPKDRPVVMDKPTPEEPYRLSANVVRLLEQEPHLYIAKSSRRVPSFDSEISERTCSVSFDSWNENPFPHSKAGSRRSENPKSFEDSLNRSPHRCCQCGLDKTPTSLTDEDLGRRPHSFSSLLELRSSHPLFGQSRQYCTTAAARSVAQQSSKKTL